MCVAVFAKMCDGRSVTKMWFMFVVSTAVFNCLGISSVGPTKAMALPNTVHRLPDIYWNTSNPMYVNFSAVLFRFRNDHDEVKHATSNLTGWFGLFGRFGRFEFVR
jgi:hypothetical protein